MKIGFCGPLERMKEAAEAGFDYLEPTVTSAAGLSETEFEACLEGMKKAPLPTPSFNVLFPGTMELISGNTPEKEIKAYLESALRRVRLLGGKTVVFGSGRSRRRPEGLPYDEAFRRLIRVTRLIGDAAQANGLTIAVEPLNRGETNMINSVGEGACLAAAADHPAVKLLADYYHIAMEGEPPEELLRVGGICHAHIATREGRRAPVQPEDGFRRMFSAMKKSGYQGLLSVEGRVDDMAAEGAASVRMLKALWEEA